MSSHWTCDKLWQYKCKLYSHLQSNHQNLTNLYPLSEYIPSFLQAVFCKPCSHLPPEPYSIQLWQKYHILIAPPISLSVLSASVLLTDPFCYNHFQLPCSVPWHRLSPYRYKLYRRSDRCLWKKSCPLWQLVYNLHCRFCGKLYN